MIHIRTDKSQYLFYEDYGHAVKNEKKLKTLSFIVLVVKGQFALKFYIFL